MQKHDVKRNFDAASELIRDLINDDIVLIAVFFTWFVCVCCLELDISNVVNHINEWLRRENWFVDNFLRRYFLKYQIDIFNRFDCEFFRSRD
jgi:hypothetical protein